MKRVLLLMLLAMGQAGLRLAAQTASDLPAATEPQTYAWIAEMARSPYEWTRERYLKWVATLNPHEKARLYDFIRTIDDWNAKVAAIVSIGHLGDAADVERLVGLLREFHGPARLDKELLCVVACMRAVSYMSYRGIPEATETMDRMIDPDYWDQFDFKHLYAEYYYDSNTEFAVFALVQKARTMDPNFPEKARAILGKLQHERQRAVYQSNLKNAMMEFRWQEVAKGALFRYGEQWLRVNADRRRRGLPPVEMLENFVPDDPPTPTPTPRPAAAQYRQLLESSDRRLDLRSSAALESLVHEAVNAFDRVLLALSGRIGTMFSSIWLTMDVPCCWPMKRRPRRCGRCGPTAN